MFKVIQDRQFTHDVAVQVPVDGGFDKQTFECRFRVLPAEQIETLNMGLPKDVIKMLTLAIVSFGDDLVGEDGQPLPFNDKLRDAMIADYPIRQGLIDTYLAALTKARSGN